MEDHATSFQDLNDSEALSCWGDARTGIAHSLQNERKCSVMEDMARLSGAESATRGRGAEELADA